MMPLIINSLIFIYFSILLDYLSYLKLNEPAWLRKNADKNHIKTQATSVPQLHVHARSCKDIERAFDHVKNQTRRSYYDTYYTKRSTCLLRN